MKTLLLIAGLLAVFPICLMAADFKEGSPVYEMRVYYAPPGKLDDLHARFRNHTVRMFEKHGMTNIGYWVPINNPDNKLIYVLAYPSRAARDESWKAMMNDPEWQAAFKESEEHGPLVVGNRIESIFLKLTDYSPQPKIQQKGDRIFELRTYTTPPEKLDELNTRFRNHTMKLFEKHGMENIAYWNMTEGENAETTLIYIIAHDNVEAQKASFSAFRNDPNWNRVKSESEKEGSLTVPGGVKSELMVPTDYSPLK